MDRQGEILVSVGIALILVGSFALGTQFPANPAVVYVPTYEYVTPPSSEITTRQNIVGETEIMLGRDMGAIRYKSVYMEYTSEGIHMYDGLHSTFIHTPTYGGIGDSGFRPVIDFYGYTFKVIAWNSDYVFLEVVNFAIVPESKIIGATIILGRGKGEIHYGNVTASYDGQDVHLTDNKGGWMYFTMTQYDPPMETGYDFDFGGYKFNVTYWSWDYVRLQHLGEAK